jgi:hypothetical protein
MEIGFINWLQDHHDRSLNNLVFHASDTQRSRLSIPFGNLFSQAGLGSVGTTVQSSFEIEQVRLQLLLVLLDRNVIDPGRFPSFQSAKGIPQQLNGEQREDVVKRFAGMRFRSRGDAIQRAPSDQISEALKACRTPLKSSDAVDLCDNTWRVGGDDRRALSTGRLSPEAA